MPSTDVLLDAPPGTVPVPAMTNQPVLTTKMQPERIRPRYITRPRLIDAVTRGVTGSALTLISGPAGSGKTILAASWAAAAPVDWPIAWLTVDKPDNNPALFWTYVLKSLAQAGVEVPGLKYARPEHDAGASFGSQLAASLLELRCPTVIIVDNAEHLDDPEILAGIDLLLRRAADRLRLVLCTRADPQLPLFRYRLAETISELRLHDLAFTVDEAEELFRAVGLTVPGDAAAALTRRTEGWAAGLRLAASSLLGGADITTLLSTLGDGDSNVAEYLMSEVLKQQDERTRQFLLRTSVVDQLTPELVDVLTDRHDGRRTLAALYHANIFIERDARLPGVYRMHPLFRSMLAAQLSYEAPQLCQQLHLRCARWFAERGQITAAIDQAADGNDWGYVATFLLDSLIVGNLLARNRTPYERILRSFPTGVPGRCAAVLRVAAALRAGLPVSVDDVADTAELAHDSAQRLEHRVSAAVVHAAAGVEAEPESWLAACDEAAALITRLSTQQRQTHPELLSVVLRSRALALLCQPDRKLFGDALAAAVQACDDAGADRLLRQCEGELALIEALDGQLRKATEHAVAANAPTGEDEAGPDQPTPASALALAWIRSEEGDNSGARRWLDRATKRRAWSEDRLVAPLVAVLRARLLRGRRDPEAAERLLQPAIAALAEPGWLRQQVLLEEAALQLALGRPERVVETLDALPDPGAPRGQLLRCRVTDVNGQSPAGVAFVPDTDWPIVEAVEAWINEACVKLRHGRTGDAYEALKHALRLAQPERLRRPFLDASPRLIRVLKVEPELASSAAWLRPQVRPNLLPPAAAGNAVPDGPPLLTQPLTERELEVLRHLSDMLTTEEIGAAMYVSVNTVRTHVRSILQKLGVRRRHDAVRRARALGIL